MKSSACINKRESILNCFALTIIYFFLITKWWYVLVIDGTDEIMYGFPFHYFFLIALLTIKRPESVINPPMIIAVLKDSLKS